MIGAEGSGTSVIVPVQGLSQSAEARGFGPAAYGQGIVPAQLKPDGPGAPPKFAVIGP
jgi:hypothetical protein